MRGAAGFARPDEGLSARNTSYKNFDLPEGVRAFFQAAVLVTALGKIA
jgi:hypothetical protein